MKTVYLCALIHLVATFGGLALADDGDMVPPAPLDRPPTEELGSPTAAENTASTPPESSGAKWLCLSDSPANGVDLSLPEGASLAAVENTDRLELAGPLAYGVRSISSHVPGERDIIVWAMISGQPKQVFLSNFLNKRPGEVGRRICARVYLGTPDGICPAGGLTVEVDEKRASVAGGNAPEPQPADLANQPVSVEGAPESVTAETLIPLDRVIGVFPCLSAFEDVPVLP